MGLLGRFQDLPGKKTFFFRVHTPKRYHFDVAVYSYATIEEARDSLVKGYPASTFTALLETEFAPDGLPTLKFAKKIYGPASDRFIESATQKQRALA